MGVIAYVTRKFVLARTIGESAACWASLKDAEYYGEQDHEYAAVVLNSERDGALFDEILKVGIGLYSNAVLCKVDGLDGLPNAIRIKKGVFDGVLSGAVVRQCRFDKGGFALVGSVNISGAATLGSDFCRDPRTSFIFLSENRLNEEVICDSVCSSLVFRKICAIDYPTLMTELGGVRGIIVRRLPQDSGGVILVSTSSDFSGIESLLAGVARIMPPA